MPHLRPSQDRSLARARQVWYDPVWSKVLAGLISTAASAGTTFLSNIVTQNRVALSSPGALWLGIFSTLSLAWASCLYVLCRKRPSALVQPLPTNVHVYSPKARRYSRIGLILLPVLAILFLTIRAYVSSLPVRHVVILVADIEGATREHVTSLLFDQLRTTAASHPELRVSLLGETISLEQGREYAQFIGARHKATVVLWGSYNSTSNTVRLDLRLEFIPTSLTVHDRTLRVGGPCTGSSARAVDLYPRNLADSFALQGNAARDVSATVLTALGVALHGAGNYAAAAHQFTNALRERSGTTSLVTGAAIRMWRADARLMQGDVAGALTDLDSVVRDTPNDGRAYNNRGNANLEAGHYVQAESDYRQAVRLASGVCLTCAYFNLGRALEAVDRNDDAIEAFSRAVTVDPGNAAAFDARGHAYAHSHQCERAALDHDRAIALSPATACYFNGRGHMHALCGDHERALQDYSNAIERQPAVALFRRNRGEEYLSTGDLVKARADLDIAVQLEPSGENLHSRGRLRVKLGAHALAVHDFSAAIALAPANAHYYWDRAGAYFEMRNYAKARDDYSAILARDPRSTGAYHYRARAHSMLGRFDEALVDLDMAIVLQSDHAVAYFDRAQLQLKRNDLERALADYREALRRDPQFEDAYAGLAEAYSTRGNTTQAVEVWTAALKRLPKSARAHLGRGRAFEAAGDRVMALRDYRDAIEIAPTGDRVGRDAMERLQALELQGYR